MARRLLRAQLEAMRMPDELVHDIIVAASELATNGLRHGILSRPGLQRGQPSGAGVLELWMYHRVTPASQLVFKVFDPNPGWNRARPEDGVLAEHGRGIAVVETLSWQWGWHRTRSRLGPPSVPGKATWFCVPITGVCAQPRRPRLLPWQAALALHGLLTARGLRGTRCLHGIDRSVVTVRGVTVWSEPPGVFRWKAGTGSRDPYIYRPYADLHDVAEEMVHREEVTGGIAPS